MYRKSVLYIYTGFQVRQTAPTPSAAESSNDTESSSDGMGDEPHVLRTPNFTGTPATSA